jgi:aryl-alcohol dehydrogenase-like predicted oxidoreductase
LLVYVSSIDASARQYTWAMIGLGCMRLSTLADRDEERSIAVIHAALEAGVTLLDTADSYCLDEREIGHNERLIAAALDRWTGDRSRVEIATKGGLTRPGGAWVPDGKAKHLRAACDGSRRALGVDAIDLYQLHVVDPKTSIETSVRALASLAAEGKVRKVGLCNVTVSQIKAARRIAEIHSVQVSLSPLDDENLRNGVAEYCLGEGIRLIAHRPLGGERRKTLAKNRVLIELSRRLGTDPETIVLAWLKDLGVVPIPGATREGSARALARVCTIELTDDDRQALDDAFSSRLLRVPRAARRPPNAAPGEVVLVMGMPGAGKTTVAHELQTQGLERLNRDERGGSLASLVTELDRGLAHGRRHWVLDNTYPSRRSRNEVIECAWRHGVPVRCIWVDTALADAQINAITRLVEAHGCLPMPEVLRERGREDPRFFGPDAQFRYERSVEPPDLDEGFTSIERRTIDVIPAPDESRRAILLDFDVLARHEGSADPAIDPTKVQLIPGRGDVLRRYANDGWSLFAHCWRPPVAANVVHPAQLEAVFRRTRELLGLALDVAVCTHPAGPPICWCRKPIPGLVLEYALREKVSLRRSVVVGMSAADRTMAQRIGAEHRDEGFFSA